MEVIEKYLDVYKPITEQTKTRTYSKMKQGDIKLNSL